MATAKKCLCHWKPKAENNEHYFLYKINDVQKMQHKRNYYAKRGFSIFISDVSFSNLFSLSLSRSFSNSFSICLDLALARSFSAIRQSFTCNKFFVRMVLYMIIKFDAVFVHKARRARFQLMNIFSIDSFAFVALTSTQVNYLYTLFTSFIEC